MRPPVEASRPEPGGAQSLPASKPRYRYVLVACARWEAASIVEWLAFHRHIGFDHVFLYCNDDDPRHFYETVLPFLEGSEPFVHFFHFGLQGQQEQMYRHFLQNHAGSCEWFVFFDIDEFLLLRRHDTIDDFLRTADGLVDVLHFHSLNAGHNGHVTRPAGPAITNFTRRNDKLSFFTKGLVRSSAFAPDKLDSALRGAWWHNLEVIVRDGSHLSNVLGEDVKGYYNNTEAGFARLASDEAFHTRILDRAFIYHIGLKSEADLMRRVNRGIKGDFSLQDSWRDIADKGPEHVAVFLQAFNKVEETRLVEIWDKLRQRAFAGQIAPPPPGPNKALRGTASQSSISEWSRHQDTSGDAAGLIDGNPTVFPNHHTALEPEPWWMVDLGRVEAVTEIRIFNRADGMRDRLRKFRLLGSVDSRDWRVLHLKADDQPFGGVDGRFFRWRPPQETAVRHVRIVGIGLSHLDFAQVEIY